MKNSEPLPLVSVVISNYNGGKYLKEAIDSVLNQSYSNLELIVVDDGSTDDSKKILLSYQDQRLRTLFLEENQQVCLATNKGLRMVNGEYIARLDSDDIWKADKLEKQMKYLLNHEKCGACFSLIDIINENGEISNDRQPGLWKMFNQKNRSREEWIRTLFYDGNCLCHSSAIFPSSVIREVGDYHPAYLQLQDYDLWLRIVNRYPIHIIEERLVFYRRVEKQPDSLSSSGTDKENRRFNEDVIVHKEYLNSIEKQTFLHAFQQDFRNLTSSSDAEIECEKAFILCRAFYRSGEFSWLGMEKLANILRREEGRELLEKKYSFTAKDYYQITKQACFDRTFIAEQFAEGTVYFNYGQGYSEEDSLKVKAKVNARKLEYQFEITVPGDVQEVRFDPLEGSICILEFMEIMSNGRKLRWFPRLAVEFQNGCFFSNGDPQIVICGALAGETISVHSVLEVIQVNCDYNLKKACKQIEKLLEGKALLSAKESHIKVLEKILEIQQEQLDYFEK